MKIIPTQTVHQELLNLIPGSEVAQPDTGKCLISPYRDANVACPHPDWMTTKFWDLVLKPSLQAYEAEQFDCDDFSIRCMDRLSACLTKARELTNAGYAASVCYLRINGELNGVRDSLHACVLYRDDRGGWWFFEPQNGYQSNAANKILDGTAAPYFLFL